MSELKYVIFFGVLFVGVPVNLMLATKFPKYEKFLWFLLLFFTCNMIDINFISYEHYRGTSRGFEIGMVDIIVFSLWAIMRSRQEEYPLQTPPGTVLFWIYWAFSALSMANAAVPLYSMFELWKMVRMYIFFYVVYNTLRRWSDFDDMMRYISYVILFITYVVMKQKYIEHIFQTYGPFPHQNSLVMYMILFGALMLGYLLNKNDAKLTYWLPVFGMAGIDIISTLSRAGMALFILSASVIFMLSYATKFSLRKLGITVVFIILGAGVLYKASDTIIERFETAPEESANVRVVLAIAARKMADDSFIGVGLNNFGLKINPPYPYGNHIPRKDAYEKGGLVETAYMMIAAETGWHNLVIFMTLLLYMYFKNMSNYFRMKTHEYRYLSIGIAGGLLSVYIETTLEWVLKQTNNFYQLIFIFAIIGAVGRLLDEEQAAKDKLEEEEQQRLIAERNRILLEAKEKRRGR